ncbi:MAG: universal stress protein [Gammaproteobacteria bacterium]|nr:universal stress protein [Gammaproteobacteria bacterium]
MKRFKNILLVCNFEVKQRRAVERAVSLAKQNDAHLTVFSVVKDLPANVSMAITIMSPQELLDLVLNDQQERINAMVEDMNQQGINASAQVMIGTPFLEVIRQVLRDKHDLVILAAEGKGGLKERLFGSTSMHLMRKCPCPVWVVKPKGDVNYKRILAAVDTTINFPDPEHKSLNPLILQLASSLAQIDKSQFHVVQVWSVFAEGYMEGRGGLDNDSIHRVRKQVKQQYKIWLERLLASVGLKKTVTQTHMLRNEDTAMAIVKLVKNEKIDLLVIGTVCRTGLAGFFIGNTAEKVLSEVNCSVLTVKPEGFVTPVMLEET